MSALLVLTRERPGAPPPPESLPTARAALALEAAGVPVLFGQHTAEGRARGLRPTPEGWVPDELPIRAVHDRFPGWSWPAPYRAALAGLPGVPVGNPPWLTALCRDKLRSQRVLEQAGIPMPPLEDEPAAFRERLGAWGSAFLKPRHGSLGLGVQHVRPGDPLPERGPAHGTQGADPMLLQRAVPRSRSPHVAMRLLLQREGSIWRRPPVVARISDDDPVVNVELGARAEPAEGLVPAATLATAEALSRAALEALLGAGDASFALELSFDLVLDDADQPWIIEVNPVPRGRLRMLAAEDPGRWGAEHHRVCAAPLLALDQLTQ